MSRHDRPLARVASAGNQALGEMWREVLEDNGIRCFLRIGAPLLGYAPFASPYDLFVNADDAERARDLLAAFNEDDSGLSVTGGERES